MYTSLPNPDCMLIWPYSYFQSEIDYLESQLSAVEPNVTDIIISMVVDAIIYIDNNLVNAIEHTAGLLVQEYNHVFMMSSNEDFAEDGDDQQFMWRDSAMNECIVSGKLYSAVYSIISKAMGRYISPADHHMNYYCKQVNVSPATDSIYITIAAATVEKGQPAPVDSYALQRTVSFLPQ